MVELVPNPDGCAHFDPNPFKKEKCKHCGRLWTEHQGVITEDQVQSYLAALKKAAEEKRKAEEDARQKARAKQLAKKKTSQAVEDEWLFDGSKEDPIKVLDVDSEDDDMGFRMFTPDTMDAAPIDKPRQQRSAETNKPLKVVNLIDFGECDVPKEPASPDSAAGGGAAAAPAAAASSSGGAAGMELPSSSTAEGSPAPDAVPSASSAASSPTAAGAAEGGTTPEELQEEIQHLRQMLADANEEKSIQVAIVRDEVAEKQQAIEELTRRRAEAEAALRGARAEVEALRAEVAGLRSSAGGAAAAEVEAAAAHAEAEGAGEAQRVAGVPTNPFEAHYATHQMGREAALALRELRVNAEQQLAWLSKRMVESPHAELGRALIIS